MIGKIGAAVGGAGLSLLATAGKGFLEGAVGKTVSGGIRSGFSRPRSGARKSGRQTGLTGDSKTDSLNTTRDFQGDFGEQKETLKSISQEAAILRESATQVGLLITKNNILLSQIANKVGNQSQKKIDDLVKKALTAAGVLGAGAAAGAAVGKKAAPPAGSTPKSSPKGRIAGGIGGLLGGLGLDYAADKASEAGHEKTAGTLGTASYAASGAGIGGTIGGARGALIGGALGGLYGLYQNWNKFGGGGSTNAANFSSKKEIIFKADKITFETKNLSSTGGGPGGSSSISANIPVTGGGPSSGQGLTPGAAATGSAAEAIQFFQSRGWTREQAAGIAANIKAESNFKTNAVGDGGRAYGIAQWHPDRQRNFQKVFGKDIRQSTFQEQLAFIDWELRNTESRAGNNLRNAGSAAEAAAIVQNQYERPANKDTRLRASIAMGFAGEGSGSTGVMAERVSPMQTGPAGAGGSIRPQSLGGGTGENGRLDAASLTTIGSGHKLESSAAAAYQRMVEAARADGVIWGITDSYRTYAAQVDVARRKGLYSQGGLAARPGTSNHGWGRAVDLKLDAKSSRWLQQNAGMYGFRTIAREPWHWEYTGGGAPTQVASGGQTYTGGGAGAGGSIRPQSGPGSRTPGYGDIPAFGAMPVSGVGLPSGFNLGMIGGRVSPAAGRVLTAGRGEYQSNGQPLYNPDGSINWGNPDNPADFFRADQARMSGAGRVMAQGGSVGAGGKGSKKKPVPKKKVDLGPASMYGESDSEYRARQAAKDTAIAEGAPGYEGVPGKILTHAQKQVSDLEAERVRRGIEEESIDDADRIRAEGERAKLVQDAEITKKAQAGQSLSEMRQGGSGAAMTLRNARMGRPLGPEEQREEAAAIARAAQATPGESMDAELVGGVEGFNAQDFTKAYKLQRAPDTASSASMGAGPGGADLNRVTDTQALQRMSEDHSNYMRAQFEKQSSSAASAVGEADKPWTPESDKKTEPQKPTPPPPMYDLNKLFSETSFGVGA